MSKHCPIMKRMKENYENRNQYYLTRKIPVIIRIDGKAFHTYTRNLQKPFDKDLISDMNETAKHLCANIQGAKCAYVQSDEISILVTDYDDFNTEAWFDYNIQKMTSVSASMVSGIFNRLRTIKNILPDGSEMLTDSFLEKIINVNLPIANFDSRCFNIPKEEVANYFYARQKDCVKNSISAAAQSVYSYKELGGKNSNEKQEMLFQKGINWNEYDEGEKRGRFIAKIKYGTEETGIRTKWDIVSTPLQFKHEHFKEWI